MDEKREERRCKKAAVGGREMLMKARCTYRNTHNADLSKEDTETAHHTWA
jgi:hypothetical protein